MNRYRFTVGVILLLNLAVASLMYGTVGWHFIRGYNEVGNFLVWPAVLVQGGLYGSEKLFARLFGAC